MSIIEIAHIITPQGLHAPGNGIVFFRWQQQVHVAGHKDPGVNVHTEKEPRLKPLPQQYAACAAFVGAASATKSLPRQLMVARVGSTST